MIHYLPLSEHKRAIQCRRDCLGGQGKLGGHAVPDRGSRLSLHSVLLRPLIGFENPSGCSLLNEIKSF